MNKSDLEELGLEDGIFDKDNHMPYQASYGASVNLNELDDDQLEAYEQGYLTGAEDYDLNNENEENF